MYKITTSTGEEILTDQANWIRVHPSGNAYLLCDRAKAEGIACHGTPYLFRDGNTVTMVDAAQAMAQEDAKHREAVEQALTDLYLDGIQAQQDLTDLQLQILEG